MSEIRRVSREEAQRLIGEGAQVVDVRDEHEWEAGHIAGAKHVPLPELNERAGEIDRERPVILYCRGGTRCEMAAEALEAAGYDAAKLEGGVVGWAEEGLPMEPAGGYVAESGKAASVLQSRKQGSDD